MLAQHNADAEMVPVLKEARLHIDKYRCVLGAAASITGAGLAEIVCERLGGLEWFPQPHWSMPLVCEDKGGYMKITVCPDAEVRDEYALRLPTAFLTDAGCVSGAKSEVVYLWDPPAAPDPAVAPAADETQRPDFGLADDAP